MRTRYFADHRIGYPAGTVCLSGCERHRVRPGPRPRRRRRRHGNGGGGNRGGGGGNRGGGRPQGGPPAQMRQQAPRPQPQFQMRQQARPQFQMRQQATAAGPRRRMAATAEAAATAPSAADLSVSNRRLQARGWERRQPVAPQDASPGAPSFPSTAAAGHDQAAGDSARAGFRQPSPDLRGRLINPAAAERSRSSTKVMTRVEIGPAEAMTVVKIFGEMVVSRVSRIAETVWILPFNASSADQIPG